MGFLESYEGLMPGKQGQASLLYIDPAADFSIYLKVLVDPVVTGPGRAAKAAGAHEGLLADLFRAELQKQLAYVFDIVDEPGPETLRLRAAIALREGARLGLELEILDASTSQRIVAAVNEQDLEVRYDEAGSVQSEAALQLDLWAGRIRDRLATFHAYDAARRARAPEPPPTP